MASLGCQIDHVKLAVGWTAEKLARLKPNGRVFGYSPLSRLLELEALAGGIRGKRALWQSLHEVADRHAELIPGELDGLIERADAQLAVVEDLHRRAASLALGLEGGGEGMNGASCPREKAASMPPMRDPRELLLHELGDILYAENIIVKALPKMARSRPTPS